MIIKMLIFLMAFIFLFNQIAIASEFRFSQRPNKAHLIKWRHWSKEALKEAKEKDKLILLSLSAVWCHWCHVMDETTYSDMDIINFINKKFIPVRVDADMRPDIDSLYNQGGWPSTAVLTAEGELLGGGTYVPPETMMQWLSGVVEAFNKERERIREVIERLKEEKKTGREEGRAPEESDIKKITSLIKDSYDKRYGGFSGSQKFPYPDTIDFLLSGYLKTRDPELKTMVTTTLDNMSGGEIYDGVAGGFFRYATKVDWSEPHYEKMLDVNAGLIRNYSDAYMVFEEKIYSRILRESINYLKADLLDEKLGVFYGSQDADEEYYKRQDRKDLKPPYIDKTIYTDSSSLMISALLSAHAATGEKEYLEISKKAADFFINKLYTKTEGVYHYYHNGKRRLDGILSDNILFGLSLIDLYNITGDRKYIDIAKEIGLFVTRRFYDSKNRKFRPSLDTTVVRPVLTGTLLDFNAAIANYRAVILLSRLYYLERDKNLKTVTDNTLTTLGGSYEQFTSHIPLYGTALRWNLEAPVEFAIVAEIEKTKEFLSYLNKIYLPEKVVKVFSLSDDKELIKKIGYLPEEAVYICAGKTCLPPITSPEMLRKGVDKLIKP